MGWVDEFERLNSPVFGKIGAISCKFSEDYMGPKPRTPKSNDLFRQRLDELVNPKHPLAQLAQRIDWSVFEHEWTGFFPSHRGRPATAGAPPGGWTAVPATHLCPIG
jgi:IS5 family transposase